MKIKNTDGAYCKIKDIKISGLKAYVTLVIYSSVPQTSADSLGNTHRVFSFYLRDKGSTKLYSLSKNNYWIDRNNNYSIDSSNIDINMYKEVILEIDISNYGNSKMIQTSWVRYCHILIVNSLDTTEELWTSEELSLISKDIMLPTISNIKNKQEEGYIITSFTVSHNIQEDFNYSNNNINYKVKLLEPNTNFIYEEEDILISDKKYNAKEFNIISQSKTQYYNPLIVCIEILNIKQEVLKAYKHFLNPLIKTPKLSIITSTPIQSKQTYIKTSTTSKAIKINII